MLLVHSGVVRIIRKNSSNLWKSTWTPPQVRTTTEILSWFYGRFWSSSWPPCCFLHRQKKDFPNVSCHVPAHLDHPHLLPITHLLALPISQPLLHIFIYIYIHPSSAGFILICSSLHNWIFASSLPGVVCYCRRDLVTFSLLSFASRPACFSEFHLLRKHQQRYFTAVVLSSSFDARFSRLLRTNNLFLTFSFWRSGRVETSRRVRSNNNKKRRSEKLQNVKRRAVLSFLSDERR